MKQTNYRRCISCRRVGHKKSFWRVVRLASNKQIQLDEGMGRSAYLCPELKCWIEAKGKNRLQSSLRAKVPDHIYQSLKERLSNDSPVQVSHIVEASKTVSSCKTAESARESFPDDAGQDL